MNDNDIFKLAEYISPALIEKSLSSNCKTRPDISYVLRKIRQETSGSDITETVFHENESHFFRIKRLSRWEIFVNRFLRVTSIVTGICLVCGMIWLTCEFNSNEPIIDNSYNVDADAGTTAAQVTEPSSAPEYTVEVGDGLYRISSKPKPEKVTLSCEYGTAKRSEGATVRAFGQTLDFSSIPDEYSNDYLPYCVCGDESIVYFVDHMKFYRSDLEMNSPTLLFTMGYEQDELPSLITELISFKNTDLLFFRGSTGNGDCVGSIDPETGEADFISCTYSMKTVPCNNGVMLYDYRQNDTALYWECGKIYEIKLCDPNEGECGAYVSANGKYICTFMWGKAEDRRLIERYSVYDTKSGEFIKSFDWTFKKKVGDHLPKGFTFLDINEETQSVYLLNTEDNEKYQFYFGG